MGVTRDTRADREKCPRERDIGKELAEHVDKLMEILPRVHPDSSLTLTRSVKKLERKLWAAICAYNDHDDRSGQEVIHFTVPDEATAEQ